MSVHFLKELGLTLTCELSVDDLSEAWKSDPYWVNWATKLDDTDLVYFLPKVYQTLVSLTDKTFNYIPVHYGDMCLYLVGTYPGEQPFGPFWHDSFTEKMKRIESRMSRICAFAQCLQEDLSPFSTIDWIKSYQDSNSYLTTHRRIVRRGGEILDVDMDDHDLSKSRIVQIALGFLWHWPSARQENEQLSRMKKLALDAVHAGHLEVENHHPEHEKVGVGSVDVYKLFADRLSVHLQKDAHDSQKGWGININFIPPQYRDEWSCFVSRYQTLDLYEASN